METAACKGSEEVRPLPRFLRLAAALVFPVLFQLRNDPRVKNTPKVKILFANTDLNEKEMTTKAPIMAKHLLFNKPFVGAGSCDG